MTDEFRIDDIEINNSIVKMLNYKNSKKINSLNQENEIQKIKLNSDAYPENFQRKLYEIVKEEDKYKSMNFIEFADVHKILQINEIKLDKDMIYFQKIPQSFLKELKILHNEWFPIDYKYDYFIKYLNNSSNYFNFGAFTKIKGIEYLVGIINIYLR